MGFEDIICNVVKLNLTLGSSICNSDHETPSSLPSLKPDPHLLPSLTLSLSSQTIPQKSSTLSTVSSFSNSRSKRERNFSYDDDKEEEIEKVSLQVANDQDEERVSRKKLRLTKEQSQILEDSFKVHTTLNPRQRQELAKRLNLRPRQIEVWFQNRRARTKLKKTEVDCELLKSYCETLKIENKRLRKELQELKVVKQPPPPIYMMQLPSATAATLSLCPCCENILSGGEKTSRISFPVGKRIHSNLFGAD